MGKPSSVHCLRVSLQDNHHKQRSNHIMAVVEIGRDGILIPGDDGAEDQGKHVAVEKVLLEGQLATHRVQEHSLQRQKDLLEMIGLLFACGNVRDDHCRRDDLVNIENIFATFSKREE